ncbi:MAG: DnaJ domain-containing protein [Gammaproteobacteria bacterium]|nr:DnaJ domain-containing protein [Gammaproteobacteria bacterium]
MAPRLFLALVALIAVMWFLAWYRRAPPERRNKSLITGLLYGLAAALLILVVTGRIPWLFALFSAAMPWINRALTVKRIWSQFSQTKETFTGGNRSSPTKQTMSREEAYEILGLQPGASEESIVQAHKELMQKIHPDRGGSDFLAAKINKAKDTLLTG